MFCQKCGNQIENNAQFCIKCGTKVFIQPTVAEPPKQPVEPIIAEPETTEKSKSKKKKTGKAVLICLLVFLFIAALGVGAYFMFLYTSPSKEIVQTIEAGDFATAAELYDANIADSAVDTQDIERAIEDKLTAIQQQYTDLTTDYTTAVTQINAILRFSNENIQQKAQTALAYVEALNASRTAFDTAKQFAQLGNYPSAIENYRLVIDTDENFDAAQAEIVNMINLYKQVIMATAQTCVENNDFLTAVQTLIKAQDITGNDTEIAQKITVYKEQFILQTLEQAESLAGEKEYVQALELLTQAQNTFADIRLEDMLKKYEGHYIDSVLAQADALIADMKYDDAKALLNESLNTVSDKTKLTEKLNSVDSYRPVALSSVHLIDSRRYKWANETLTDSFGNTYDTYYMLDGFGSGGTYAVYNLIKEYTTFSGTIVACSNTASDAKFVVRIYVDDVLQYTSVQFGKTTGKLDFNIDTTSGTKLKIVAELINGKSYYSGYNSALVNCTLTKDPSVVTLEPATDITQLAEGE